MYVIVREIIDIFPDSTKTNVGSFSEIIFSEVFRTLHFTFVLYYFSNVILSILNQSVFHMILYWHEPIK